MRLVAIVLACLACVDNARRIQEPNFEENQQTLKTQDPSKALATVLLNFNPAAFNPSSPARLPTGDRVRVSARVADLKMSLGKPRDVQIIPSVLPASA